MRISLCAPPKSMRRSCRALTRPVSPPGLSGSQDIGRLFARLLRDFLALPPGRKARWRLPSLRSCIAFSTFFEAPLEYFLATICTNVPLPLLPAHIEATIRAIARLHAEHHQNATPLQRADDRITGLLGRPRFIGMLIIIAADWIRLNLLAAAFGYHPIDPPPFSELEVAVSLVSLYMVVLILTTQRREYQLAQLRE